MSRTLTTTERFRIFLAVAEDSAWIGRAADALGEDLESVEDAISYETEAGFALLAKLTERPPGWKGNR